MAVFRAHQLFVDQTHNAKVISGLKFAGGDFGGKLVGYLLVPRLARVTPAEMAGLRHCLDAAAPGGGVFPAAASC